VLYGYLLIASLSAAPGLVFFYMREDLRKEILLAGVAVGISGVALGLFFFTQDWWRPETITGTPAGIEDFIHGFGIGSFSVAIYKTLFRKHSSAPVGAPKRVALAWLLALSLLVSNFLFFWLGVKSYYAAYCGILAPTLGVYYFRPDLIRMSLFTGAALCLASIPFYLFYNILDPGYIERWWLFSHLTNVRFLGIPMEDLVFYLVGGMFLAPLPDFWRNSSIEDAK
jgi:hypothetical protein